MYLRVLSCCVVLNATVYEAQRRRHFGEEKKWKWVPNHEWRVRWVDRAATLSNVCLIWSIFNWIYANDSQRLHVEHMNQSNNVIWFERRLTEYWITCINYYHYYHYYAIVHSFPLNMLIVRVRVHRSLFIQFQSHGLACCFANIGQKCNQFNLTGLRALVPLPQLVAVIFGCAECGALHSAFSPAKQ